MGPAIRGAARLAIAALLCGLPARADAAIAPERAVALALETGRCADAMRSLDALDAAPEGSGASPSAGQRADRALLRAYAHRCAGQRVSALASAEAAAALDERWAGAIPRFGGPLPEASHRMALGAFAAEAWDRAALEGGVPPEAVGASLAWFDAARPTSRAGATLESLAWRIDPDPQRRARRRVGWLGASAEHTDAAARAQALLRDPSAAALLALTPAWRDVIWEVARAQALRGRPALAEQLVEPELRPEVRRWDAALRALEGRRPQRARERLSELASLRGRVAAEASWALIVDARRGDRDAEALERVEAHLQRHPTDRRGDALDACVHLAGAAGDTSLQRLCWERRRALSVDDALATLTAEVVVDALVFDGAEAAAHVLDSASSAGVPTTIALRYWRARVDGLLGDTEAALDGFRAVFELAPLSWYALWADAHAHALGAAPKWRAWVRTLRFAEPAPIVIAEDAYARELERVGLIRAAQRERSWRAMRSGRAPYVALAAESARVLGDDDGAAWTLARHGDAETMTEVDVAAASGAMWRAVFPTPFDKAVAAASAEAGVARSWLWAVARRESAFDPGARSGAGALGLMQVLPATAREVARRAGWREIPTRRGLMNVETNARSGAAVLAAYYRQLGPCWEPTLMAYASGPARALRWMPDRELPADIWLERMPYPTVRRYVRDVITAQAVYAAWEGEPPLDTRCDVAPR